MTPDDNIFVCVDRETQTFVPFDDFVRLEVERVVAEFAKFMDENDCPPGHPLRAPKLAEVAALVESAFRQNMDAQRAAFHAPKH
jgi:hypothetical protein